MGQRNFVLVWVQIDTMGEVQYSARQYYHGSFLERQKESQTTLFRIPNLWTETRTWYLPNIKEDTTHSTVTLRYIYSNKDMYPKLTGAHLCSLHPVVHTPCNGRFHCPCDLQVPEVASIP